MWTYLHRDRQCTGHRTLRRLLLLRQTRCRTASRWQSCRSSGDRVFRNLSKWLARAERTIRLLRHRLRNKASHPVEGAQNSDHTVESSENTGGCTACASNSCPCLGCSGNGKILRSMLLGRGLWRSGIGRAIPTSRNAAHKCYPESPGIGSPRHRGWRCCPQCWRPQRPKRTRRPGIPEIAWLILQLISRLINTLGRQCEAKGLCELFIGL